MAESEKPSEPFPGVPYLSKTNGYGIFDGSLMQRKEDDDGKSKVVWICDGVARIAEEVRKENGDAIFTIEGLGKDGYAFRFDMDASDFAESRTLNRKLTAQFGACNRVGELTGDVIQLISRDVKKFRLVETPRWIDGKVAVPGIDLIQGVRYAKHNRVPVDVSGGNLNDAQKCLQNLLDSWDPKKTSVALAAQLGGPIISRWYPGDRFGLVLQATTGAGKTAFITQLMAIYGRGYLNEETLSRWGHGSTVNALMKAAAVSGFIPFLVDNFKPVPKGETEKLVGFIHAILEGSDKSRLTSDSKFAESLRFDCLLIITGEDFPMETSTMLRCIVLDWTPIQNPEKLSNAQGLAHNMTAIWREWLLWLSENSEVVNEVFGDFDNRRNQLYKELIVCENAINPGRLATNITLLRGIWDVAMKCPALSNVLTEFKDDFEAGIDDIMKRSPAEISAANEAEDFVATINELLASGQVKLAQDNEKIEGHIDIIGWIRDNGEICIFPKIARMLVNKVSPTTQNLSPNRLHKQLEERGYIKVEKDAEGRQERTLARRFGGKTHRVLVFTNGIVTT